MAHVAAICVAVVAFFFALGGVKAVGAGGVCFGDELNGAVVGNVGEMAFLGAQPVLFGHATYSTVCYWSGQINSKSYKKNKHH